MNQNYINHVALVIDQSSSMSALAKDVVQVADQQIEHLARRSKELDQETRATVYTFSSYNCIQCVYYDKDVLRMPSLKGAYRPDGMTALLDATLKSIEDLEKTAQLYGDHAFLIYVLTDGEENDSNKKSAALARIRSLPENWTLATFVPNERGRALAEQHGFPRDNVAIWETTSGGIREVGETIRKATDAYMTARSVGVRGSKNLFNVSTVDKSTVASTLPKLHPGQYRMRVVDAAGPIAPFVEDWTHRAYKIGEAFYQLSKPEKVQPTKAVALLDKKSKAVYTGADARKLLGLPDHEVRVAPASFPDFDLFIQSGSVNRKLVAGTSVLLLS